jgi:hypothetical protein
VSHKPSAFVLVLAALLGLAGACSTKTPAAPTAPTNVSGTWTGSLTVQGTTARMTWTLAQTDTSVTGPVNIGFTSGTVLLNGFLSGSVSGSSLGYTISVGPGGIPNQPACVGQFGGTMSATIGAPSTLTGPMNVTSSTCTVPINTGTITLTRP